MSEDDDLRINTLHRFAKHSPRLVLQEYSHCEVPAGCGGVVLRWLDPAQGVPVSIRMVGLNADSETWLDGAPLASSRAQLASGRRVIAFHLRRKTARPLLFTLGVHPDSDDDRDLVHAGAPRWCVTEQAPGSGWQAAGFDDAGWAAPAPPAAGFAGAREGWETNVLEAAQQRGQPLHASTADQLWGRVTFAVAEAP
jgi:hypothetical protein